MASAHLVFVRADDDDWRLGGVASDGAEPEVEASVLVSETDVPEEKVDGSVGKEELRKRGTRKTCGNQE